MIGHMIGMILLLIILVLVSSLAYAASKGAPWVPTVRKDIDRIIKLADVQSGDVIYELGCGDARVLRNLVRAHSGSRGVGYDLSILHIFIGQITAWVQGFPVRLGMRNILKVDCSGADIVYLFLMPEINKPVTKKLMRELKPGSKIIAFVWPLPDLEPIKIDEVSGRSTIYLYEI